VKSIWNGSISFGLVNIPVKLYSATEQKKTKTRLLHKEKLSPIRYKKWCDDCTEEVQNDEIVRAIEVSKGRYVILEDQELKSIKPEKSTRIEIVEFVNSTQINPIHFNSHYYAGPESEKDKTYFLFREVLRETAKVAIGRFVMREKEYVCAIEAFMDGMLLTTLNYADEIRNVNNIPNIDAKPKLSETEMDLARQLIDRITSKEFDITKYEDTFQIELEKIVSKKEKGETIAVETAAPEITTEENLIEALRNSLK
jgi:DNA end-binding protein Ku